MPNVIIDQHFAERGRIGRLLGAVSQNPRVLGIGIDEDTAIVVTDWRFGVIGSGAVYVVDGSVSPVSLHLRQGLDAPNRPVEHVYFLESGIRRR